jgi:site-specific DNA-methyltransferase (adenine-specific)
MKPLDGTFAHNATTHGVAGLNIDDCRVPTEDVVVTNHARSAAAAVSKGAHGDCKAQNTHQTPGQALGRWAANVIHDGSEGVTGLFPASRAGSASRFFYCAKASKAEKNAGCESLPVKQTKGGGGTSNAADFVCSAFGSVKSAANNSHPTVKPLALCKYLATLILPPDARARKIIVPFSGSGSEMLGAAEAGWEDITGIESDTENGYIAVAEARLKHCQESLNDESTT